MVEMIGLFFLIGLASEYAYARWTVTIVQHRFISLFWAGTWAVLNVLFVLQLASSQDLVNGLAWVLGIVAGTSLELLFKKPEKPQVLVPYDLWEIVECNGKKTATFIPRIKSPLNKKVNRGKSKV